MSLKSLNNDDLIASTKTALKVARESEVHVLRHFREIDERKLWVGVGSLYKFLEKTFSLSSDQVYPRLQAMRLVCAVPEAEQKLEVGELTVSHLLKAQQAFTAEAKERVVPRVEKAAVLEVLARTSTKEAEKILASRYPDSKPKTEKVKPVANNLNLVQFYADDKMLMQIEDLKAKYSHRMPSGKLEDLIKILLQNEARQPKGRQRVSINNRSRYIPADVKREMEKTRIEGCCWVDAVTQERCGSKHFLQMDHIQEYSRGGSNEVDNLRWLCGFHNRFRFETGRDLAKVKPVR